MPRGVAAVRAVLGRARRALLPPPTEPGWRARLVWEARVAPDRRALRRVGVDAGAAAPLAETVIREGVATGDAGLLGGDAALDALTGRWEAWRSAHPEVIDEARAQAGEAATAKTFLVRLSDHVDDELALDDPLMATMLSRPLLDVVARALGSAPLLLYSDIWLTLPTGRPPMRSQHWHRDPEDRRIVKVFTLLDDVGAENGPLWFVPRSHRRGALDGDPEWFREPGRKARRATDDAVARVAPPETWWEGTGPRGMVTLVDTTGLHRGGLVRAGERLLHTATFATAASDQPALQRLQTPPEDPLARLAARRLLA